MITLNIFALLSEVELILRAISLGYNHKVENNVGDNRNYEIREGVEVGTVMFSMSHSE